MDPHIKVRGSSSNEDSIGLIHVLAKSLNIPRCVP